MAKTIDQDISVLSTAKHGLVYLTPNDWTLIADKAVRMTFKPGESIVHKGKRTNGVYLVLGGRARAQNTTEDGSLQSGPGEIYGANSYLDGMSVRANDSEECMLERLLRVTA